MIKNINMIIMGGFTYPKGMAGTKRIQHVIDALKQYPDIFIKIILQRQSSEDTILSGVHESTPYETIMGDLRQTKMFILLPLLYYRTILALKMSFRSDCQNVIYFYGPLFLESIVPLRYAQRLGYKIVFDVIEDYDLEKDMASSFYEWVKCKLTSRLSSRIKDLATGIIVISSRLEEKYRDYTQGKIPIHYMSISVDMDRFPEKTFRMNSNVSLFYAGSFAKKDGLAVLLDAFDRLAGKYGDIRLVLTGRGDSVAMQDFFARMEISIYKNRIDYKGYLEEKDYYALLNSSDIPCMTRVDLAYAQAGFPFKLGEFLATGKPVIASRVSDIDRILVQGTNAMVVQAGSSMEVCEAVEFLIENPESAVAIGMQGREVAKLFFDYKLQGKSLYAFLENL